MAEGYQNKRVERSKAAVLAETYRQLSRGGMSGVSIDDVSRESGVAKTTIYRHWPTRSALLIDACSRMGAAQPAPGQGDLHADLRLLVQSVAEQLRTAAWTSVLPSIIDAAERDSDIATMQSSLQQSNTVPFSAAIESAKARGEVSSDVSAPDLIAMMLGPLFYRRWFSKEKIDDPFVDAVVDMVVEAATSAKAKAAAVDGSVAVAKARSSRKPRRQSA